MDQEISKEINLKDLLDSIKENTRESKMIQNFLYKINELIVEQNRILKEIKRGIELR